MLDKSSEITEAGIREISQILAQLTLLKRLNLDFSEYLKKTSNTKHANSCHERSDRRLEHLFQSFEKLVSLQSLTLSFKDYWRMNGGISKTEIEQISKTLETLKLLKNLSLDLTA